MRYLSVCSGIEAATVAWHPLGWEPAAFSEIEAFPRAVLTHHYPTVPLHGDFTTIEGHEYGAIDVLVGGTPCQDFSVAGLRAGIAGDRGNLTLEFLRLAARTKPRWIVWENVPGVLSSDDGRALGAFLGGLAELGYGFAYRVLDAQFAGVPQRRRRIFVVGYLGDWRRAAAVLFEQHSLQGHSPPSREKGKAAPTLPSRSTAGGGLGTDFDCDGGLIDAGEIAPTLRSMGHDGSHANGGGQVAVAFMENVRGELRVSEQSDALTTGGGKPGQGYAAVLEPVPFDTTQITSPANYSNPQPGDPSHPLAAGAHPPAVVFESRFARNGRGAPDTIVPPLKAQSGETGKGDAAPLVAFSIMPMNSGKDYKARETDVAQPIMAGGPVGGNQGGDFVKSAMQVRRLTPRECERLQGFPDDYTLIPVRKVSAGNQEKARADIANHGVLWTEIDGVMWMLAADGPRYKALGNSMAVPVMAWIGERIAIVDAMNVKSEAA